MQEWLDDPRGRIVFRPMYEQMKAGMSQAIGGEGAGSDMIGMDMTSMILDMPLSSILHFQENEMNQTPEEIVAGLLQKVRQMP